MKLFFILFIFFGSILSLKADVLDNMFINQCPNKSPYFKKVYLWSNEKIDISRCKILEDYHQAISLISQMTHVPPAINISLYSQNIGASSDDTFNLINTANIIQTLNPKTNEIYDRSLESNITTFIHEYSHSIFGHRLKNNSSLYRDILNKLAMQNKVSFSLKFFSNREQFLKNKIKNLNIINNTDRSLKNKLKKTYDDIVKKLRISFMQVNSIDNKALSIYKDQYAITSPYTEMFADFLSALVLNDPEVMSKAITYPDMTKEHKLQVYARNFKKKHPLKTWNFSEVHILFAPARDYLDENFMIRDLTLTQKSKLIDKVYFIMQEEVFKRWSDHNNDVTKLNNDLINKFKLIEI